MLSPFKHCSKLEYIQETHGVHACFDLGDGRLADVIIVRVSGDRCDVIMDAFVCEDDMPLWYCKELSGVVEPDDEAAATTAVKLYLRDIGPTE
jgi:hypothetical protein